LPSFSKLSTQSVNSPTGPLPIAIYEKKRKQKKRKKKRKENKRIKRRKNRRKKNKRKRKRGSLALRTGDLFFEAFYSVSQFPHGPAPYGDVPITKKRKRKENKRKEKKKKKKRKHRRKKNKRKRKEGLLRCALRPLFWSFLLSQSIPPRARSLWRCTYQ
jgi:hypothetical protein